MRKSHENKHSGENNSQFGTCWVYNEQLKENKKVDKKELEHYINYGWQRGRRFFNNLKL